VAISVSDLERSIKFYEIFGFKHRLFWEAPDKSLKIEYMQNVDSFLELFCFKEFRTAPQRSKSIDTDLPAIGVKHFALKVTSIEETLVLLTKSGFAKPGTKISQGRTGMAYFFISDPDGILMEIVQDDRVF
jgi:glyoxylase I family protein